jgi:hypothetical protein
MMQAASTSETSVNFYRSTRSNNPEDSHLYIRHRENLKSQQIRDSVNGANIIVTVTITGRLTGI